MKFYDAVRMAVQASQQEQLAQLAIRNSQFDPRSPEAMKLVNQQVFQESMHMALGLLVRLDLIDDPHNDQIQASARELLLAFSKRTNIDPAEQWGVPLLSPD